MINIQRDVTNPPLCLETEKKRELSGKIKDGNYRCDKVIERIKTDFFNKCYICENCKPTSINVEHFRPHKSKNIDLKFSYSNLFFACAHCNNCKSDDFENILDCTNTNEDVENWIDYRIEPMEGVKAEFSISETNKNASWDKARIDETIKLLDRVFNGEHTNIKEIESENLRSLLIEDVSIFYQIIRKFSKNQYHSAEQKEHVDFIKSEIRKDSNFTAFKRSIIKRSPKLKQEFEKYFD